MYSLMSHVDNHINNECSFFFICSHPLCDIEMKNANSLKYRLGDAHGLLKKDNKSFCRKRILDSDENNSELSDTSNKNTSKGKQLKLKVGRNSTLSDVTFIDCNPVINSEDRRSTFMTKSGKERKLDQNAIPIDPVLLS